MDRVAAAAAIERCLAETSGLVISMRWLASVFANPFLFHEPTVAYRQVHHVAYVKGIIIPDIGGEAIVVPAGFRADDGLDLAGCHADAELVEFGPVRSRVQHQRNRTAKKDHHHDRSDDFAR